MIKYPGTGIEKSSLSAEGVNKVDGRPAVNRVIEYVGELLPDGHLSVPEEIRQTLAAIPYTQIQITIRLLQPDAEQVQEAWTVFRHLGRDAGPGRLADASTQHDRYLYGKES